MNNSTNKITVLIPTYNRSERLKIAINSVLNQKFTNLVLIVSDNASKDNTENVLMDFAKKDNRVKYKRQEKNIGMNENLNFLVSLVDTPFFCFLSDDDYYHEEFLENALEILNNNPKASFACFEGPAINEVSNEVFRRVLDKWPKVGVYQPNEALPLVLGGQHFVISACVYKRELLPEFYFDNTVAPISDMPIVITLAAKYTFYVTREVGMHFVRHANTIGISENNSYLYWNLLHSCLEKKKLSSASMIIIDKTLTPFVDAMLFENLKGAFNSNDPFHFKKIKKLILNRKKGLFIILKFYFHFTCKKLFKLFRFF